MTEEQAEAIRKSNEALERLRVSVQTPMIEEPGIAAALKGVRMSILRLEEIAERIRASGR
jgi:hypothetical protein